MLFKRAIFRAGLPVVLFLSRHKVDPSCREAQFKCRKDHPVLDPGLRYCYPVFGEELPLNTALVGTPLALCIGYEKEGNDPDDIRAIGENLKDVLRPHLEPADFDFEYAAKEFERDGIWSSGAIMLANKAFVEIFPK